MNAMRLIEAVAPDLDDSTHKLASQVVSWAGLSPSREADLQRSIHRVVFDVIAAADGLVAAAVELEAIDVRLDEHMQSCLRRCRWWMPRYCSTFEGLKRRRDRLQRRCDSAYRSFVARGGRR